MVGLQTTRLESRCVNYYRVILDFTSREGKNTLWFYSLVVRNLLQVKVQNSNDFIAREKVKKPKSEKVPSPKKFLGEVFWCWVWGNRNRHCVPRKFGELWGFFSFLLLMLSTFWTWKLMETFKVFLVKVPPTWQPLTLHPIALKRQHLNKLSLDAIYLSKIHF